MVGDGRKSGKIAHSEMYSLEREWKVKNVLLEKIVFEQIVAIEERRKKKAERRYLGWRRLACGNVSPIWWSYWNCNKPKSVGSEAKLGNDKETLEKGNGNGELPKWLHQYAKCSSRRMHAWSPFSSTITIQTSPTSDPPYPSAFCILHLPTPSPELHTTRLHPSCVSLILYISLNFLLVFTFFELGKNFTSLTTLAQIVSRYQIQS